MAGHLIRMAGNLVTSVWLSDTMVGYLMTMVDYLMTYGWLSDNNG